ncbi:MAG TPA: hypothetical protein VMN43_02320 [Aestuariivirgaceae bacterium]|nr:hypothetical protein [Aestuariivirgaceae bacterium]
MADSGPNNGGARHRLQKVLAAYGADPAYWPERDRECAFLLATADPALAVPLEDARVLDLALARASRPLAPAGAADRIARLADASGKVVSVVRQGRVRRHAMRAVLPGRLAALTALAASLALGLYLGANGQGDWLIPPLPAEDSPEYLSAELNVLDGTLQLFEDHM